MTRPFTLWFAAAVVAVAGASLGGGLWLGRQQARSSGGDQRSQQLNQQVQSLQEQFLRGDADASEQQRLLELLVASGRKGEATTVLEQLADQQPQRWPLRLLLAELRRDQGDRSGAERELRQVLSSRPDQIEALQLQSLLMLEAGEGLQAAARLQATLKRQLSPRAKPEALATGLLLAEVLQKLGSPGQAEAVLIQLATAFPGDQRPLLARALVQQQRGDIKAAQQSLAAAKGAGSSASDNRLDQVASAWGLASLRAPARSQQRQNPQALSPTGPQNP